MAKRKQIQLGTMGLQVRSLTSLIGLRIQHCPELWYIGPRHSSDLALLWLWCRLAAVAPIRPLAWTPLYAMGAVLKIQKMKKNSDIMKVSFLKFFIMLTRNLSVLLALSMKQLWIF